MKKKELKLGIETIDDLYQLIKRSNFVKNLVIGYAIKICIDNEDTIKKEIEKLMENEEQETIDLGKV